MNLMNKKDFATKITASFKKLFHTKTEVASLIASSLASAKTYADSLMAGIYTKGEVDSSINSLWSKVNIVSDRPYFMGEFNDFSYLPDTPIKNDLTAYAHDAYNDMPAGYYISEIETLPAGDQLSWKLLIPQVVEGGGSASGPIPTNESKAVASDPAAKISHYKRAETQTGWGAHYSSNRYKTRVTEGKGFICVYQLASSSALTIDIFGSIDDFINRTIGGSITVTYRIKAARMFNDSYRTLLVILENGNLLYYRLSKDSNGVITATDVTSTIITGSNQLGNLSYNTPKYVTIRPTVSMYNYKSICLVPSFVTYNSGKVEGGRYIYVNSDKSFTAGDVATGRKVGYSKYLNIINGDTNEITASMVSSIDTIKVESVYYSVDDSELMVVPNSGYPNVKDIVKGYGPEDAYTQLISSSFKSAVYLTKYKNVMYVVDYQSGSKASQNGSVFIYFKSDAGWVQHPYYFNYPEETDGYLYYGRGVTMTSDEHYLILMSDKKPPVVLKLF